MQKKLLIAFDDPGGGLAVISVLERLKKEKDLELNIYSGRLSEQIVLKSETDYRKIRSTPDRSEAETIMNEVNPDLLLTGTGGGSAEQELRNIAFERDIRSVVILDFWKDYSRRWLYSSYPVEKMKDKICIMDELTKLEMIEENFPEESLIVTGHPYLDRLFNFQDKVNNTGVELSGNNYLFLSQPLEVIGVKDYEIHPVKLLLEALRKLSILKKEIFRLTIKLHPSEEMSIELSKIVQSFDDRYLKVSISERTKTLDELLNESEFVIGYNTIAMFESRALGKETLSMNVVQVKNSLMEAMKAAGIRVVNASENEIYECLAKANVNSNKKSSNIFKGGIENCTRVILKELNLN
jgi:hypothetical protein